MKCAVETWAEGVKALCASDKPYLVIEVDDVSAAPVALVAASQALVAIELEKPESVASVLVPMSVLRSNADLEGRLLKGVRTMARWRRGADRPISGWAHSYYERLAGRYGNRTGQIEQIGLDHISHIIEKMNRWDVDVRAGLYAHTNLPGDRLRTRGAPCLQYIQIELHNQNQFTMNALYRSHDYGNKCLGNLIGLCRLGALFSQETGRSFSRLRVISLNPFLPAGKKQSLENVVNGLVFAP